MSFEGISCNFSKVGNICQANRRCALQSNISEKQKKHRVCFALQLQPLPLKCPGLYPQNFVRYSRHRPDFSGLGVDFFNITTVLYHIYCAASVCNISGCHINCVRKPHCVNSDMQLYSRGFSRIIALFPCGICIADAFLFLPRSIFARFDQAG